MTRPAPSIVTVMRLVAISWGLPLVAMTSPVRRHDWLRPRQAAMDIALRYCGRSRSTIARRFRHDRKALRTAQRAMATLRGREPLLDLRMRRVEELLDATLGMGITFRDEPGSQNLRGRQFALVMPLHLQEARRATRH